MSKTIPIVPASQAPAGMSTAIEGDGMGCHSGGEKMLAAAKASGKSEVLAQYAKDYPVDPKAGPTINRKACALRLVHCVSACACAARPPFCLALHAACMA